MGTLRQKIDALGKTRDRIHALKTEEAALADDVRKGLAKRPGKTDAGKLYSADLVAAPKTSVEDLAALKRAAGRKFLQVIRADVKAIRAVLGDAVLKRIGRLIRGYQLKVYRTKRPATAPRRSPGR